MPAEQPDFGPLPELLESAMNGEMAVGYSASGRWVVRLHPSGNVSVYEKKFTLESKTEEPALICDGGHDV